jgi:hypothetical protein
MFSLPPWRPLLCVVVVCAALAGPAALHAGDAPAAPPPPDPQAVVDFGPAMASGDSTVKREALRAVIALGKEFDDAAYKCLIQATGDRQTHDDGVLALRSRSGLSPGILNSGPGYPGYPVSDSGADWAAWLAARTKDKAEKKQIADQAAKIKDLEKKKDEKDKVGDKPADKPGDAGAPAASEAKKAPAEQAPSDLGKPSRIIFRNGGSLVCYVIFKRTDPDGVLQSVRIIHLDGGGEETLTADLIARIEESAR